MIHLVFHYFLCKQRDEDKCHNYEGDDVCIEGTSGPGDINLVSAMLTPDRK